MKDILYILLGSVEGNVKENLIDPVDKVDQLIHDAISAFGDHRYGGEKIIRFLEAHIELYEAKGENEIVKRLKANVEKLKRAVQMFS